jgi:hypothetical protein
MKIFLDKKLETIKKRISIHLGCQMQAQQTAI